jgi:hypothetical protein
MPTVTDLDNRPPSSSRHKVVETTSQIDPPRLPAEPSTGPSSFHPRRVADRLIRLDEKELATISEQVRSERLPMDTFLSQINLAPGNEVTLALPEERVITLRRAGRGDVIWVDPAPAVYVIDAIVRGKMRGMELRALLVSPDAHDLEAPLLGVQFQGVAIQGVLPKREDYHDYKEWKDEAITRASCAVHELAHSKENASEYAAFKKDHAYRSRLGVEPAASPQQILDEISSSLYKPRDIMRAVVDAATIENGHMMTAELHDARAARWYGASQGGGCAVLLRAWRGPDDWNLTVSRIPREALTNNALFNHALLQPIARVSISDEKLLAGSALQAEYPETGDRAPQDIDRTMRQSIKKIAENAITKLLERSAEEPGISRNQAQGVFFDLGLIERRTPIKNFLLDLFGI